VSFDEDGLVIETKGAVATSGYIEMRARIPLALDYQAITVVRNLERRVKELEQCSTYLHCTQDDQFEI
jgi:hypothetical protein